MSVPMKPDDRETWWVPVHPERGAAWQALALGEKPDFPYGFVVGYEWRRCEVRVADDEAGK